MVGVKNATTRQMIFAAKFGLTNCDYQNMDNEGGWAAVVSLDSNHCRFCKCECNWSSTKYFWFWFH